MSEGVSTATGTINTQLTNEGSFFATTPNEIVSWASFNLKIIFAMCLFCLIFSIMMSSINAVTEKEVRDESEGIMFVPPQMRCGGAPPPRMRLRCPCNRCRQKWLEMNGGIKEDFGNTREKFSNDEMYSYKSAQHADYQSIPLLPKNDKFNNPENMLFGQANRHIYVKDNVKLFNLEIYCNLYVLEGNIFDKTPRHTTKQHYKVYLLNDKNKTKLYLNTLEKDGDGMYKLKVTTDKVEDMAQYDKIVIAYALNNNEQILLQGSFN